MSSECRFRKPSREFFLELLRVSGLTSPDKILVIGDSLVNDVHGATSVGLRAVLVDRNIEASKREFPESVPCVRSLDDLMQCVTSEQLISEMEFRP